MKRYLYSILFLVTLQYANGQVQDGTLVITGSPSFSQSAATQEAGLDDSENIIGSLDPLVTFILNETINPVTGDTTSREQNCETVYLYKVFMHTSNMPAGTIIKAKTFDNSGSRFPLVSNYDGLPPSGKYFGDRDLVAETNGADIDGFITIPDDGTVAIKVFEFKGCREDIPVEFRVTPSVGTPSGTSNFQVYYTITAEPFS
ncbi:hypothetical protein [Mariniflexile sp. AS56]|uniref:hypothetical protein n=1 Tax=Mariniflexile sp. AS56 TaxID=3063957 RepID=UPI0026F1876D|nr:hypothetical protein [Mariniflexile sp. AS56]MDO7171537.1 hypothetical protein [Mariniflexile sp. AS56]